MTRRPNYKKWQAIFIDYTKGLSYNDLVQKHRTSKRTISKAINFYKEEKSSEFITDNELRNNAKAELDYNLNEFNLPRDGEYSNIISSDELKNKITQRAKQIMKINKSLNNKTRMRLILTLYVYNELSLGRLSKKLSLSKSTVLRHIKALENTGIVKIRHEKVRSPKLKQYYSVVPNILEVVRFSHSMMRHVSPKLALETHIKDLENDKYLFSVIANIFNGIIAYYNDLEDTVQEFTPSDHQTIENIFSSENLSRFYFWFLSKKQYEFFKVKYKEFFDDLMHGLKEIENKNIEKEFEERPFFVWHSVIPIKKILEKKFA